MNILRFLWPCQSNCFEWRNANWTCLIMMMERGSILNHFFNYATRFSITSRRSHRSTFNFVIRQIDWRATESGDKLPLSEEFIYSQSNNRWIITECALRGHRILSRVQAFITWQIQRISDSLNCHRLAKCLSPPPPPPFLIRYYLCQLCYWHS